MKAKVALIAKERFYYDGRNVEKGEQFDAWDVDVSLLTHALSPRATFPEPEQRAARAEAEPEAKPATYKRRDLEAEDS
jgi:hypothetical protein